MEEDIFVAVSLNILTLQFFKDFTIEFSTRHSTATVTSFSHHQYHRLLHPTSHHQQHHHSTEQTLVCFYPAVVI